MADGLYKNIQKKRRRIKAGSGETMRKPGSKGAPTNKAFKQAKKTAKKNNGFKYILTGLAEEGLEQYDSFQGCVCGA